ncbi:MAG TPA: ATP-binding protein [Terracidiphilus sp.]
MTPETETRGNTEQAVKVESISLGDVATDLHTSQLFADTPVEELFGVDQVERVTAKAGAVLVEPGETRLSYWLVLSGNIHAERLEPDGSLTTVGTARPGEGFGEVPLLLGKTKAVFLIRAIDDSVLLRFAEEAFWTLMSCCPSVRRVVLANMGQRIQMYQVEALHREKLVSLGTLAAGLMHELHNPGAAAKRAASMLRENLMRLQQLSLRFSDHPKTQEQLECVRGLLEHTMRRCHAKPQSSLEQSDAEEAMSEWLTEAGVENAYKIGPALVEIGFDQQELRCARAYFEPEAFSDALNWLEALVSSVSHVCAIEESISRISELVSAVKKFAYGGDAPRELDIHESLQSTLTILGHKLRIKQIGVEKRFNALPATIVTRGSALGQVWTNLIDNAADASPLNGQIEISTWGEPDWLVVCIGDHGGGIPPENLSRIFDAFFTTKPQGSGTGLGLEIVHRIVTQKFGGKIDVESKPGDTRFIVRLPRKGPLDSQPSPEKNGKP